MSDVSGGPGWWLASDGRWYAPDLHPSYRPSAPAAPVPGSDPLPTFDVTWQPPAVTQAAAGRTTTVDRPVLTHEPMPLTFSSGPPPASRRKPSRTRWLVSGAVALVAVVALVVGLFVFAGPDGWSDTSLRVVGSPISAGGTVVLLNVTSGHQLEITGVQPASGKTLWSRPYSASQITPGVAFTPVAVGDTVLDLVPMHGAANPEVEVEGVDARTGSTRWTATTPMVASDAPVVCLSDKYFCVATFVTQTTTDLVALRPSDGQVVGALSGPYRNVGVTPPGVMNDSSLWQTDDQTPTLMQISPAGQPAWTTSVADLFGGTQYDPDYGWDFLALGELEVGSVGVAPVGATEPLGGYKTVGVSAADGSVVWTSPGDFLCGGGLQFLTASVSCRYTGSAVRSGASVSMSGVSVALAGLNTESGATTWTLPVAGARALSLGANVPFADGDHLVVELPDHRRAVLDARDGTTRSPSPSEVFWCEHLPLVRVDTPQGASTSGQRASTPVFGPCTASGAPASTLPSSRPSAVGIVVGGEFVWPTPDGLRAAPQAS